MGDGVGLGAKSSRRYKMRPGRKKDDIKVVGVVWKKKGKET